MQQANSKPIALNAGVQQVVVNVHAKILPTSIWRRARQMEDRVTSGAVLTSDGESSGTGTVYLNEQGRSTSIEGLMEGLVEAGFHLVFVGRRQVYKKGSSPHAVIRFVFGRTPQQDPALREMYADVFDEFVNGWGKTSLWNVLGFVNPYYKEGVPVEGLSAISIDVNGREALVDDVTGAPVLRWQRNEAGEKVSQYELRPSAYIGVDGGEICVLCDAPAEEQGGVGEELVIGSAFQSMPANEQNAQF